MENKLEKVIETCSYVAINAKHVKINYETLDKVIESIDISKISYWLESNPFNLLDFDSPTIINFLLVYHTIGDYCFWGDPKWSIKTPDSILDGSFAMMYLLINHIKNNKGFMMSLTEFERLLSSDVKIPLLEDRYNNLCRMNQILKEKGLDFYTQIQQMTLDSDLFNYIISTFDYFNDESEYRGNIVYFYKRAQLITSDILHVREIKEGIKVDYTHLVGCADYKIPQVMRMQGILEYDEELANLVDNKIPIPAYSEMELEIRACDIIVIDYIAQKLEEKVSRININDYIWLLGQDKSKTLKPYHRTLTNKY